MTMEQTISEIAPSSSIISHQSKENETKKRPNLSSGQSHPVSLRESIRLDGNETLQTDEEMKFSHEIPRKKRHNSNSSDGNDISLSKESHSGGDLSQSTVNDTSSPADGSSSSLIKECLQTCHMDKFKSVDLGLKEDVQESRIKIYPIKVLEENLGGENVSRVNNVIDEVPILVSAETSQSTAGCQDLKTHSSASLLDQSNVCPEQKNGKAVGQRGRKLLILDVNGILADIVAKPDPQYKPDAWFSMKAVFKRPLCDDFLQFCFDNFNVGIWSSRNRRNVDYVVDFLMGEKKNKLLFCWDQSHCTNTGHMIHEDSQKPIFLKEIKKLWDKEDPNLPWQKGDYHEFNTLLMDDSPHKALCNPQYTGVFPYPYEYLDIRDNLLGRSGKIRLYLERLVEANNVQEFVMENPFGQRAITPKNLSWPFYSKILGALSSSKTENKALSSSKTENKGNDKSDEPKHDAKQEPPLETFQVAEDLTQQSNPPSEAAEVITSVARAEDGTETPEVIASVATAEELTQTMETSEVLGIAVAEELIGSPK